MSAPNPTFGLFDLTSPAIITHPNLSAPKAFKGPNGKPNGEPKYSVNLVVDPSNPDFSAMKAVAVEVARAKWPNRPLKELAFPFINGDKLADKRATKCRAAGKEPDGEFQRGKVVIPCRSQFPPAMAAVINGKATDISSDNAAMIQKHLFFGAEAMVQIKFSAYDGVGANPDGVTAYLQQVFGTGRGERIGGTGRSAAQTFGGYMGRHSNENPTIDDEIPF